MIYGLRVLLLMTMLLRHAHILMTSFRSTGKTWTMEGLCHLNSDDDDDDNGGGGEK